jgi:predicted nucleic-acid-binding Zn-ribbon protein
VYYNKEELERLKKQSEEYWKQKEEEEKGYKYTSEAGLQIVCTHCKYERFEQSKALLNTRGMTFLDLDWLNDDATILICKRCGYTHWFCKEVKKVEG